MNMYNVNKLVLYMYVVSIESKKWYFLLFWQKRDFLSYTIIRHLHDFIHLPIFPHSRLIRTTRLLGTLEYVKTDAEASTDLMDLLFFVALGGFD